MKQEVVERDVIASPASRAFAARIAKYALTSTIEGGPSALSLSSSLSARRSSTCLRDKADEEKERVPDLDATLGSTTSTTSKTRWNGTKPDELSSKSNEKNVVPGRNERARRSTRNIKSKTTSMEEENASSNNDSTLSCSDLTELQSEIEDHRPDLDSRTKKKNGKRKALKKEASTLKLKVVKKPRGYAGPETYEHLRPVNDLLRSGLDLVFCGIKYDHRYQIPLQAGVQQLTFLINATGKRSSTLGHHFSHPTNKFWRSVHQSGLTSRLFSPLEDGLMMEEYNYGMTNLVDRPTSEQSELSTLEMRLNVRNLTLKFIRHRPKVVCFVGKKIWDVYEGVVGKTATVSETRPVEHALEQEVKLKPEMIDDVDMKSDLATVDIKIENDDLDQPARKRIIDQIPLPISNSQGKGVKVDDAQSRSRPKARSKPHGIPFDPTQPRLYRLPHLTAPVTYTYFWVVPNTSGLERTPLSDQIVNFTSLRMFLASVKNGWQPSPHDGFNEIDVDGVGKTVEEIQRAALSKSKAI
ncbi:hypothetical protein IAR55_006800 [Kwoniella newhampshirensis]|uniref:Uracil-DNA glycosylase-like domain-containing protein n=1 Tax=Kwoniella newhampshirensis TaxID=1651941 RepID=A0AAW0YSP9_9TREE